MEKKSIFFFKITFLLTVLARIRLVELHTYADILFLHISTQIILQQMDESLLLIFVFIESILFRLLTITLIVVHKVSCKNNY